MLKFQFICFWMFLHQMIDHLMMGGLRQFQNCLLHNVLITRSCENQTKLANGTSLSLNSPIIYFPASIKQCFSQRHSRFLPGHLPEIYLMSEFQILKTSSQDLLKSFPSWNISDVFTKMFSFQQIPFTWMWSCVLVICLTMLFSFRVSADIAY